MIRIKYYYLFLLKTQLISWRMFSIMLISILTMDTFLAPVRVYCEQLQVKMSQWGFALIWHNKYVGMCFLLIYVFAVAVFPRNRKKDCYIISRIGVSGWAMGQSLFIITLGWIYTFFLCLVQNLLLLNNMELQVGWGKGWGTLANSEVIMEYGIYTTVPYLAISNYSPVYANLLVFLIFGLLLGMLGVMVFWLNFYSKVAGPLLASGLIFLSLAAAQKTRLHRFSPVSWIRLDSHYRILNPKQPSVGYILVMLILGTILFILLARIRALETQENNRRKG